MAKKKTTKTKSVFYAISEDDLYEMASTGATPETALKNYLKSISTSQIGERGNYVIVSFVKRLKAKEREFEFVEV